MKKEAKLDLKTIIPIILLTCVLVFVAFAAVTVNAPSMWGNITLATGNTINISTNINFTLTMPIGADTDDNITNVTIMFNASYLAFDNNSNLTNASTLANLSYITDDSYVKLYWNLTGGNFTNGTTFLFGFNVTPVADAEKGNVTIRVVAMNISGDIIEDNTAYTIHVDARDPVISLITANHTNESTNVSVLLNFTVSDMNLDRCFLYVENLSVSAATPWGAKQNGTGSSLSNVGFRYNFTVDGNYSWNVWCNDTLGHSVFSNYTNNASRITIDTSYPVYGIFNITNESSQFLDNSSDFNATNIESMNDDFNYTGVVQGGTVYAFFNFTDATTGPRIAYLQIYNLSQWVNISPAINITNIDIYNISYTFCDTPDCYQSGRNVSMRVIARDHAGNENATRNLTVQVNDTVAPTVTLTIDGDNNFTNVSNTYITLNWTITELNNISWMAWSVDGAGEATGSRFFNYTASSVASFTNVYATMLKGGSIIGSGGGDTSRIPKEDEPQLANGTHGIIVRVADSWGNVRTVEYNFTVDTQQPSLSLGFDNSPLLGEPASYPVNLSLAAWATVNASAPSGLTSIEYNTTCNTTLKNITNATTFQIFNGSESGCSNLNTTIALQVIVTAGSGTQNISTFSVGLDAVAPDITLDLIDGISAIEGYESNNLTITLNFSTPTEFTYISSVGYYLDDDPYFEIDQGTLVQTASYWNVTNISEGGTHTLMLQANDSVGNIANSTKYTFTVAGDVNIPQKREELNASLGEEHIISIVIRNASKNASMPLANSIPVNSSNTITLAIDLELNTSNSAPLNVTIDGINASKANWEYINFTVESYNTTTITNINTNYTASILRMVSFTGSPIDSSTDVSSIDNFISDPTGYYGRVVVPYNITKHNTFLNDSYLIAMWFQNESDFTNMTLIGACNSGTGGSTTPYTSTKTTPCYNVTGNISGGIISSTIFVPYFSTVVLVNDTNASNVTIIAPTINEDTSSFLINLSVSGDANICRFKINASGYYGDGNELKNFASGWTEMAAPTGTVPQTCLSSYAVSLLNATDNVYNLTVNVSDPAGNQNITSFLFNVTDIVPPQWSNVTNGSITSSGAIIRVESNEYVNASVIYLDGTVKSQTSSTAFTTKTPTISLSLTADASYNYTVQVCDYAGNCNISDIFNLTADSAADAAEEAAASSGGGGGGATVGAVSNVAAKQSQVWNKISAGESVTMKVSNDNIAFTQIAVNVENQVMSVAIETSSLKDTPSETTVASSNVYQYLQIKPSNLADADISSATINFEVTTAWLTTNNVANDDIALLRYKDGAWNVLDTKVVSSSAYKVKYEATSPGFSYFAIGSKSGMAEVAEAVTPPTEVTPPAVTPPEAKPIVTPPAAANYIWLIVLIAVVLIVLIYIGMRKKKQV